MPKNTKKFAYFTIALPLDSEAYGELAEESQQTGTSIPKLVPVKLREYYRLRKQPPLLLAPVATSSSPSSPHQTQGEEPKPRSLRNAANFPEGASF